MFGTASFNSSKYLPTIPIPPSILTPPQSRAACLVCESLIRPQASWRIRVVPSPAPRCGLGDDRPLQDPRSNRCHEQHHAINGSRGPRKIVLAHPAGHEPGERQPEEQMQVCPQDCVVYPQAASSRNHEGSLRSLAHRCPIIASLSRLESQSITITVSRIIRIRNDTLCHSSTRICSARCSPMPPAPTIPMMVAERVLDSK